MSNPLLDFQGLPRFADIRPEHALPAITETIAAHRRRLAELLDSPDARDFDSFVVPLEDMQHELARLWSPIGHLHSVLEDPGWRDAYNACLPLLTEHGTEMAQNKALQEVFEQLAGSLPPDAPEAQRTLIEKALRDFRLGGVALPEAEKTAFREAMQELAAVQAKFEQNLQDATDSWHLQTDDPELLRGLPEQAVARAQADAARHGESGWRLSLDYPTWQAVIMHADDRLLRKRFYDAWSTRASDQGGFEQWDNSGNIERILALRHRLARLVGFGNYAEYSLATKMAANFCFRPGSRRTSYCSAHKCSATVSAAAESPSSTSCQTWLWDLSGRITKPGTFSGAPRNSTARLCSPAETRRRSS